MAGRIIAAVWVALALAGCAGSSDEPTGPSSKALASWGYDAYYRGEYGSAVAYFEEALTTDPKNVFARKGLAASRNGVVYFGDRLPVSRETVNRDTGEAIRRASRQGFEAYARGDMAGAAARFDAILTVEPDNTYALEGLEVIRRKIVEREIVEGASARAVALDPVPPGAQEEEYFAIGSYEAPDSPVTEDLAATWTDRSREEAIAGWTIPPDSYR